MQDFSSFRLREGFQGRSAIRVQCWWLVQSTVFLWSPQFAYGLSRRLLRRFDAKVGRDVLIHTFGETGSGATAVVSQLSYLCTGAHDYTRGHLPIYAKKSTVEPEAWIAAGVLVAPGVTIGRGAVIGARSSVFADMPLDMMCVGNPPLWVRSRRTGSSKRGSVEGKEC